MEMIPDDIRPLAREIKIFLGGNELDLRLVRAILSAVDVERLTPSADAGPSVIAWPLESGQRAALAIAGDRLIYAVVSSQDETATYRCSDIVAVVAKEIDSGRDEFAWVVRRWAVVLPDQTIEVSGLSGWDAHDRAAAFMQSLMA